MGIVYSGISIIDNLLNAQSSAHTILRRKANNQIHVKLGNVEKEEYPTQADIDAFGASLQYMNNSTEWVTGPNCEMTVLDFGKIGEKFKDILDNDIKLLCYSFQVPEAILGSDKGFVGSAEIQDEGFDKNIKSYQKQIGFILKTKIFDTVLAQNGKLKPKYKIIWGKQTEEETNKLRESYKSILASNNVISPGMRKEYEKKLALLDGIDYDAVEKENDKLLRRENREKKKSFAQQIELQKNKSFDNSKETPEQEFTHFIFNEMLLGRAPQEIELELIKNNKLDEKYANELIDQVFNDFEKDYTLEEWVGEYIHIKKNIEETILSDTFETLKAKNKADLAKGLLNKKQIEATRKIMLDGFQNKRGIRYISNRLRKIGLKNRYITKDGKFVLSIDKTKRPYMIARTETVRLRAEGSLAAFQDKNINKVVFTTTSARPCPECVALEGNIYNINESHGMIPIHSSCRCCWTEE